MYNPFVPGTHADTLAIYYIFQNETLEFSSYFLHAPYSLLAIDAYGFVHTYVYVCLLFTSKLYCYAVSYLIERMGHYKAIPINVPWSWKGIRLYRMKWLCSSCHYTEKKPDTIYSALSTQHTTHGDYLI